MSKLQPKDVSDSLVCLPPAPAIPKLVQAVAFSISRRRTADVLSRRYGNAFTLNLPAFGRTVMIADKDLIKEVYSADPNQLGAPHAVVNGVFGPGSVFNLDGDEHRQRRRLVTPPFHGKAVRKYESIVEEETLQEIAKWPEDREFPTYDTMLHITLSTILRAIFGARGDELEALRRILPPWVTLVSRLALVPRPSRTYGRYTPWGRLAELRRQYDQVINKVMDRAENEPDFSDGTDVLTLLMHSSYEDGSKMTRGQIADELLTFLGAGHETTAATLSWVFERISRYPDVLAALVEESRTDAGELRQATIYEVQRNRTVVDFVAREVHSPVYQLGNWTVPQGYSIVVSIPLMHQNADAFPDPQRFDPYRFVHSKPSAYTSFFMPFGGGTRRCVGAAFANMEINVVLRTVLRHCAIVASTAQGERYHSRGITWTPKEGGKIMIHRRKEVQTVKQWSAASG